MVVSVSEKIDFLRSIFGQVSIGRDGVNVAVKCPMCVERDVTKKRSTKRKLIIRLDNDVTHCWVCGWSSKSLHYIIERYGTSESLREYHERFNGSDTLLPDSVVDERSRDETVRLPRDFRMIVSSDVSDPIVKDAFDYLVSRGIDEGDMWFYKFGVSSEDEWRGRVLIPSFSSSGELNYITGRSIDKWTFPRYWNSKVPKTSIIFNEININWTRRVVLCEGPFDMVKCGRNSIPLLGSELPISCELFKKIIMNSTPIALSPDSDMFDKSIRIADKLKSYGVDVSFVDIQTFHDPGSMTKEQYLRALSSSIDLTWDETLKLKISKLA